MRDILEKLLELANELEESKHSTEVIHDAINEIKALRLQATKYEILIAETEARAAKKIEDLE